LSLLKHKKQIILRMSSRLRLPSWPIRASARSTDRAQGIEFEGWAATAADPASSKKSLWLVASHAIRNPALARLLAANPALPRPLMWYLGRYARWDVAAAVARNPQCPRRVHAWQAYHSHWAARAALASNTLIDRRVLRRLVIGSHAEPRVLLYAAANPVLDPDLVADLLSHRDRYVRAVAAAHDAASPDQLRRLTEGLTAPAWVLRAAAANPACPPEVSDQVLTWIALGGPRSSDPMFEPLACTGHPGNTEGALEAWYIGQARSPSAYKHPLWRVRASIALANATVPIEQVRELCRDPRLEVRRSVAGLIGIPMRNVRELMSDADAVVASRATFRRADNIKRAHRGSAKVLTVLALRLGIPVVLVFGGFIGRHILPSGTSSTSANDPAIPVVHSGLGGNQTRPVYLCDTADTSRPNLPAGQPDRRRDLPGGGWLTCGRWPGGRDGNFIVVAASHRALTIKLPSTAMSGSRRLVGGRLVIPAGHRSRITLPNGPFDVVTTIASDGGDAIIVDLEFPDSAQ
jgi:hypothetical protein